MKLRKLIYLAESGRITVERAVCQAYLKGKTEVSHDA